MAGLGIVKKSKTQFTKEELQKKLPNKKNTITEETVALINEANNDPMFNGDEFVKNMVEYKSLMDATSASIPEYINALKFCAYLESEENTVNAYKKARANDQFVIDRIDAKSGSLDYSALTAAATRYRKTPLVRQILTQSDMPLYLLFQGSRYKAVAVLADEMENAPLSKDRVAAADKLLTHVKPPEQSTVELDIGMSTQAIGIQESLNNQLMEVAARQKKLLEAGVDIADVQRLNISTEVIDVEVEEV